MDCFTISVYSWWKQDYKTINDIKKGYMFIAVGSTINTINDIKKGYMFIAVGTLYIQ